jgi:hypothetical protein
MKQELLLEILIQEAGHECIFLPKFHCELNPIEMVSQFNLLIIYFNLLYSAVLGMV